MKKFCRLVAVAIVCLVLFASQEANSYPMVSGGTFWGSVDGFGFGLYEVQYGPWMLVPPIVIVIRILPPLQYPIIISGREHFGFDKQVYSELAEQLDFDIMANSNLLVKSNLSGVCNLYELSSGKLANNDIFIKGNNEYQTISFQLENKPYLIQFEVDGQIIYQQPFYLLDKKLYKGGKR